MISEPSEAAIDHIVASCNGDIRGALKALLLVNEQLEAELAQPMRRSTVRRPRARRQRPALIPLAVYPSAGRPASSH